MKSISELVGFTKRLGRGSTARNTTLYTIGNMLPQFVNVLLLPVLTRYLSPSEYGIFSYTCALCAFLFVAGTLSVNSYVLRNYFECEAVESQKKLFGSVFIFLVVYNLVIVGVGFLFFPSLFASLAIQVPFEPYMKLALLNNFIEIMAVLPQAYFRVRQEAGRFITLTMTAVLLGTGLSFYLVVVRRMGILGRYYGVLGANSVMLAVYLVIIIRISSLSFDMLVLKKALGFSLPLVSTALLYNFTSMSDRFILERYVDLSMMGLYAVGLSMGNGLFFLTSGIYKAIEPDIFRMASQPDFHERIIRLKKQIVLFLLATGCMLIVLSKEMVTLLVSTDFHESYKIVICITIAMFFQGVAMPVNCYLMAIYKTRYMPVVSAAGALCSIVLNLFLIPFAGIYGAAFSVITSNMVTLWVYGIISERVSDIRWNLGTDLLLATSVFCASLAIVQVNTQVTALTILVKIILLSTLALFIVRSLPTGPYTGAVNPDKR